MSLPVSNHPSDYTPDRRLDFIYDEASRLNEAGMDVICPAYVELSEMTSRYEDSELLGQGAIKDVYRTYDNRAKRWVAMARLREDRGAEFYDLFVHEAWLTSSLSHPNIIKVHDVGVDGDGIPFFTMDLKGNTTLADVVAKSDLADRRELLGIFIKVCDAVAYGHSRGVIHLDLKPENIQADDFGETLVCDWGLGELLGEPEDEEPGEVREVSPHSSNDTNLIGGVRGTPGFMAPEQVIVGSCKDHRTDVFSLGCILHMILTGDSPFLGSRETILDATSRAIIASPRINYPDQNIPKSLEAVVMKALECSPDDRYHSVLDLKGEISSFLRGYATRAERPSFLRETRLFYHRNRVPVIIVGLAFTVLSVLSVLYSEQIDQQIHTTMQERHRGTQLANENEVIQTDYDLMVKRSGQAREELAEKLARSANSLKNLGIFKRPVPTVRESHELTSLALDLHPGCLFAISEKFSLNCISLNFKEALTAPPDTYPDVMPKKYRIPMEYIGLAEAFPEFAYDQRHRPSIDQLVAFLKKARTVNPNIERLIERMLCYDLACRGSGLNFYPSKVMMAVIEYLNGGGEHLRSRYKPKEKSLFLWSDQGIHLLGVSSGECVLRFISIQSLKLDIAGRFSLSDLHTLPIESLDISQCRKVLLGKAVSLPFLREIRVRKGQISLRHLQRVIQTTKNLKIIEVPGER